MTGLYAERKFKRVFKDWFPAYRLYKMPPGFPDFIVLPSQRDAKPHQSIFIELKFSKTVKNFTQSALCDRFVRAYGRSQKDFLRQELNSLIVFTNNFKVWQFYGYNHGEKLFKKLFEKKTNENNTNNN